MQVRGMQDVKASSQRLLSNRGATDQNRRAWQSSVQRSVILKSVKTMLQLSRPAVVFVARRLQVTASLSCNNVSIENPTWDMRR